MGVYPDYPENRLIVNGVDLTERWGLILIDGFVLEPPSPKVYEIDIPGGDGVIDLTNTITGDVHYQNRTQTFDFYIFERDKIPDQRSIERIKTQVSNFLHGKEFDYRITMDPDYTYHGRFAVQSYSTQKHWDQIQIRIVAKPYKLKQHMSYHINATGGRMYTFESGRRKVHPLIETANAIRVEWKGKAYNVGAGTYRLNFCVFEQGINELYINSRQLHAVHWDDVDQNGSYQLTYDQAKEQKLRWDDLQRLGGSSESTPQKWSDVKLSPWENYSATRWNEVDYKADAVNDGLVYVSYDWEDL